MIPRELLKDYEGKKVEVYAGYRSFRGTLKSVGISAVVVEPTNRYDVKKYGPAIIDMNRITSIRQILTQSYDEDLCEDSSEDAG